MSIFKLIVTQCPPTIAMHAPGPLFCAPGLQDISLVSSPCPVFTSGKTMKLMGDWFTMCYNNSFFVSSPCSVLTSGKTMKLTGGWFTMR